MSEFIEILKQLNGIDIIEGLVFGLFSVVIVITLLLVC